jgi:hypothetical protein
MSPKLSHSKNLRHWIALGSGLALGWLLMHLLVTNWSSLKALLPDLDK